MFKARGITLTPRLKSTQLNLKTSASGRTSVRYIYASQLLSPNFIIICYINFIWFDTVSHQENFSCSKSAQRLKTSDPAAALSSQQRSYSSLTQSVGLKHNYHNFHSLISIHSYDKNYILLPSVGTVYSRGHYIGNILLYCVFSNLNLA